MQTNHTKSSAAQTKAPSRYSIRRHQAVIGEKQNLPLVIGKRYLKVENIDLEELSVNFYFISILFLSLKDLFNFSIRC